MSNKLPNGRDLGGIIKTQGDMDRLYERQVIALENIAEALAKLAGTKVTSPSKAKGGFFGL